jgi:hypothetical protein
MKRTNKIIGISMFFLMIGFNFTFTSGVAQETFDPKFQVLEYLTMNADIMQIKIDDVDQDGYTDIVILYEKVGDDQKLEILENAGAGFQSVWDIDLGDAGFIGKSSNMSVFEIGDVVYNTSKELIIGGGSGTIYIINCTSAQDNNYSVDSTIIFSDYEPILTPPGYKRIPTTLLCADIDNYNKEEIILGNTEAMVYALTYNISASNFRVISTVLINNEINHGSNNAATSLAAVDPSVNSSDFILFLGATDGQVYASKYDQAALPWPIFDTAANLSLADSSINSLAVADVQGDSKSELIIGTVFGSAYIYQINAVNSYTIVYDGKAKGLIASGNEIFQVVTGDFVQSKKNLAIVGNTQPIEKIKALIEGSEMGLYWDSSRYIRLDLVCLETYSKPGVDSLIATTKRNIYLLSTDFSGKDADSDSLSDLSERLFYQTDSAVADTDSDGLGDGFEIFVHFTDPNNPDSDGDLIPDGWEVAMGTDPNNPLSSILIIIMIPAIIVISALAVITAARRSIKEKRAAYDQVKNTPNLLPQVRRLIIQRLESFSRDFKGFNNKSELSKFKRNLSTEVMAIVLDRLYNFLEYIRLKGIIFTDQQEEMLKDIVKETIEPVENKMDTMLKTLLMYETKYKQFNEQFTKLLDSFADWKKATKKGTKIVEELIRCPKCETLQPKGSAFCLECGEKLV